MASNILLLARIVFLTSQRPVGAGMNCRVLLYFKLNGIDVITKRRMDNIHPFPTRWRHCTNGGYEDVCFPINTCNQCNQMAIPLRTCCSWSEHGM